MVVDVCTYNGEKELWDIHYNVLKDHVDEFIVVEFDKTFSGEDKPFYGEGYIQQYMTGYPFIKYCQYDEDFYEKYRGLAESSPNTKGADHWKREFMQKESIKDALTHLNDNDLVFIGDVDEVWDPAQLHNPWKYPNKLMLKVYTYYLNNRSSEEFWGTLTGLWGNIKPWTLNMLRSKTTIRELGRYGGWHFTSQGGYNAVDKKLKDSYTEETYYNQWVKDNLEQNIAQNKDFLGRDFEYTIDESEWPQYLKDNREKYAHLCKTAS